MNPENPTPAEQEPPDFDCPLCKSKVQQKNAAKHMLKMHNDTTTLNKYVKCHVCQGLFVKHKLTPHVFKAHGKGEVANSATRKQGKKHK